MVLLIPIIDWPAGFIQHSSMCSLPSSEDQQPDIQSSRSTPDFSEPLAPADRIIANARQKVIRRIRFLRCIFLQSNINRRIERCIVKKRQGLQSRLRDEIDVRTDS